jgi:hypothetical protein
MLPGLVAAAKEPAWIGFIPKADGPYFQCTYHDGQLWFQYMLFPEGQLPKAEAVKEACEWRGLPPQAVKLDGDCFLTASLGPGAGEATLIGPRIVRDVAGVSDEDSAFGEPSNFGVWKNSISRLVPVLLAAPYARHFGQQGGLARFPLLPE